MSVNQDLEKIAANYHLSEEQADMFIENMCQDYEIRWIQSRVHNPNESSVIDFGIGDGRFLKYLSEFRRAKIVEGSKLLVDRAQQLVSQNGWNIELEKNFFEDISIIEEFDYVLASHVLEHVDNPKMVLSKAKSLLKYGGKILIVVPNRESIHRRIGLKLGMIENLDSLSERDHLVGHQRVYNLDQLTAEIRDSGFEILEHRGFFLKPLSNDRLTNISSPVIQALLEVSDDLPTEQCANIGLVAQKVY